MTTTTTTQALRDKYFAAVRKLEYARSHYSSCATENRAVAEVAAALYRASADGEVFALDTSHPDFAR